MSTIKAVYHMSYHVPARRCEVLGSLQEWLRDRAKWNGGEHTSWVQPDEALLDVYIPMWNSDYDALRVLVLIR